MSTENRPLSTEGLARGQSSPGTVDARRAEIGQNANSWASMTTSRWVDGSLFSSARAALAPAADWKQEGGCELDGFGSTEG